MPGKRFSGGGGGGKKWNSGRDGGNQRDVHRRIGGQRRPVVSPWESGVAPGAGSHFFSGYGQSATTNQFLLNAALNSGDFGMNYGAYGAPNKMRRLDRMGGFDDHRGRGLLPVPPSAPLLGAAPSFLPQSRGPENLQHRLGAQGASWSSSFQSGFSRDLSSGYYPTEGRQDNSSRRYVKARRSSHKSNSRSGIRDARDKLKGSSNKSSKDKAEKDSKESKTKDSDGDSTHKTKSSKDKEDDDATETKEDEEKEKTEGNEEEAKSESKTEGIKEEKEESKEDQFPAEALYCHICDIDNFKSKKGYIRHLQGIAHSNMAEAFHAKNAATLQLLNVSSKFAQMRRKDKLIRKYGKKGLPQGKVVESSLVKNFLNAGSCCGKRYKSPYELEEHKLSIQHLLSVYDEKKEGKKSSDQSDNEEGDTTEEDFDRKIAEAKEKAEENPLSPSNITPYDGSTLFGLQYIEKQARYRCQICRGQMFRSLDIHCVSFQHYENILNHLNKEEERKIEEKIEADKQKEEEEKRKKEEEEKAKEAEKKESETKEETENAEIDGNEDLDTSNRADESELMDELDVNYSDDEIKSSSKGVEKYLNEEEDEMDQQLVEELEDPAEMIVLDEKEFELEEDNAEEESTEKPPEEPKPPVETTFKRETRTARTSQTPSKRGRGGRGSRGRR